MKINTPNAYDQLVVKKSMLKEKNKIDKNGNTKMEKMLDESPKRKYIKKKDNTPLISDTKKYDAFNAVIDMLSKHTLPFLSDINTATISLDAYARTNKALIAVSLLLSKYALPLLSDVDMEKKTERGMKLRVYYKYESVEVGVGVRRLNAISAVNILVSKHPLPLLLDIDTEEILPLLGGSNAGGRGVGDTYLSRLKKQKTVDNVIVSHLNSNAVSKSNSNISDSSSNNDMNIISNKVGGRSNININNNHSNSSSSNNHSNGTDSRNNIADLISPITSTSAARSITTTNANTNNANTNNNTTATPANTHTNINTHTHININTHTTTGTTTVTATPLITKLLNSTLEPFTQYFTPRSEYI